MTPDQLREVVARAISAVEINGPATDWEVWLPEADAALAVVREALREPCGRMIYQGGAASDHPTTFLGGPSYEGKTKAARVWRAMLASSALGVSHD